MAHRRRRTVRDVAAFVILAGLLVGVTPASASAQAITSGTIVGTVVNDAGAVLPGVQITVTSPALQLPELTTMTDEIGSYTLLDLPTPGVYRFEFRLDGFQSFVRSEVNIVVGLSGQLDVTMTAGSPTDTLEVAGVSPVVDVKATHATTSVQRNVREGTAVGGGLAEVLPMTAGVSTARIDVGDSQLASRSSISAMGVNLQPNLHVEGLDLTTDHSKNTSAYMNSFGMIEVQMKTVGNSAEAGRPGVTTESVVKSGGNEFHGGAFVHYSPGDFQGNNVTEELAAQGFSMTNQQDLYYDWMGDLGGRLIRDKLWFYGIVSRQSMKQRYIGYVEGPNADGCYLCGDAPPGFFTRQQPTSALKFNYQPRQDVRVTGVYINAAKKTDQFGASGTSPYEATMEQDLPVELYKGGLDFSVGDNLFVDLIVGRSGYQTYYIPQPGTDRAGNPNRYETTTNLQLGAPLSRRRTQPQWRNQVKGNATFLRGNHAIRFGADFGFENTGNQYPWVMPNGAYVLYFENGEPDELRAYNVPNIADHRLNTQGIYVSDVWKASPTLTLSLGLRYDRYHSFMPEQEKPPGPFSQIYPAATFPYQSVLTWTNFVPRVGATWDVRGDGKTVLKAFFGMFGDTMGDQFPTPYNPNALGYTKYRWSGPCKEVTYWNGYPGCDYLPGSIDLSLDGPDFISRSGGVNTDINPDLKQYRYTQVLVNLERELATNLRLNVAYVYNRAANSFDNKDDGINFLRPYEIWDVPVEVIDPYDGQPVTVWTYPDEYRGAEFERYKLVNIASDRPDIFHCLQVQLMKRFSDRFNIDTSYWTTKNHIWLSGIPETPNDDRFPLDDTWKWQARINASYSFPWGLRMSGFYRAQNGVQGRRTQTFRDSRLNQGRVTLPMEEYGTQTGPMIGSASITVSYRKNIGGMRIEPRFQVFNLFNSGAYTGVSWFSGTFGRVTGTLAPRVMRLGLRWTF